jgi:hypothetical protein
VASKAETLHFPAAWGLRAELTWVPTGRVIRTDGENSGWLLSELRLQENLFPRRKRDRGERSGNAICRREKRSERPVRAGSIWIRVRSPSQLGFLAVVALVGSWCAQRRMLHPIWGLGRILKS